MVAVITINENHDTHRMGVSENKGYVSLGVLPIRTLLFRVLYLGPLSSETPISAHRSRNHHNHKNMDNSDNNHRQCL